MSDDTRLTGVQRVEGVSGGEPVRVDIASIDESTLATAAKQDTELAKLDTLHTDLATTLGGKLDTIHSDVDGVEGRLDTLHTDLATTLGGKSDSIIALAGTARSATTPSKADAATGRIEADKRGNAFVNPTYRHRRRLALTSGWTLSEAAFSEGPCDGIMVDTDNLLVYAQPPERALIVSQDGSAWTGAAGWSREGNIWTHAAGGGTGDLEITTAATDGIIAGLTYAVVFTVTITAGTSVTAKLGTGAGSARSSSNTYRELITSATNGKFIFTPTNDLACTIDMTSVYAIPHDLPIPAMTPIPFAAARIVAVASGSTPATAHTTAKLQALWLRRPGAVELA